MGSAAAEAGHLTVSVYFEDYKAPKKKPGCWKRAKSKKQKKRCARKQSKRR